MFPESCSVFCTVVAVVIGMLLGSAITITAILIMRWKKMKEPGYIED